MNGQPSLNDSSNGRDHTGRFAKGNKLGRGNPHGRAVNELRAVLFEVVTPERYRKAVEAVLTKAEAGDHKALAELSDRLLGKVSASDAMVQRVAELEAIVEERMHERS
jgi:hypothetical protein